MDFVLGIIVAAVVGLIIRALVGIRAEVDPRVAEDPMPAQPQGVSDGSREILYELSRQMPDDVAHPADLLNEPAFQRGTRMLIAPAYSIDEVVGYAGGHNDVLSFMAFEALAQRPDAANTVDMLLEGIGPSSPFGQFFIHRAIKAQAPADRPVIGEVLKQLAMRRPEGWLEFTPSVDDLRQFASDRLDGGETPSFGPGLAGMEPHALDHLKKLLGVLKDRRLRPLREELDAWQTGHVDIEFLKTIGRVHMSKDRHAPDTIIEHPALLKHVADVHTALTSDAPRSVLLIGEAGVGKGAVVSTLAKRLLQEGWTVFEAGSPDILAGQKFIGELEERVRDLVRQLSRRRRVLWVIPSFHQLAWAGRHQYSPVSILDLLMPYIEQSEVLVLGKTEPGAFERLIQQRPSCSTALLGCRVPPLSERETLSLALQWAELPVHGGTVATRATVIEAWRLAQQYLADKAAPGNLLHFLSITLERLRTESAGAASGPTATPGSAPASTAPATAASSASPTGAPRRIETGDLVVTLSRLTGLPASILDERAPLDLDALRRHFETRVLGQPEAVQCLVERVAMIKAHVTDPTRPLGVFLFAGPTGTGKTEIAKSLAEFLFGSPDRMIRLDMSEFQSEESLRRIFGSSGDDERAPTEGSLVAAIRKQPFSVVLLDEFEKAHFLVWDVFLQVFDDGRLTDRRGNLADFRQAVIILTSNLGGLVPTGTSLGFSKALEGFRPEAVRRTVERSFRREFVNRIDRIVVFHPLARETMRDILVRELDAAFQRRGLRNRGWAVEWEDAAIEFLLDKGFTADMGARPLKRAIDRYVLAPLAMTIVKHQYPQGDQFLFVTTAEDHLRVQFVDPDAAPDAAVDERVGETQPAAVVAETPAATVDEAVLETLRTMRLESIVLQARGNAAEIECLRRHVQALQSTVEDAKWQNTKKASLELMSSSDFWDSPTRFAVLGETEYLDRIEAGVKRSASLFQRLAGAGTDSRRHFPVDLVRQLGQQLFLLRVACEDIERGRHREAFVHVESSTAAAPSAAFGKRLGDMYQAWARKRRMQCVVLEETHTPESFVLLLAVSGYGAYALLESESGLHVFEEPEGSSGRFRRHQVRVRVVPQPDEPAHGRGNEQHAPLRDQAREILRSAGAPRQRVVRRYREQPSPLVRDGVRGWRTGRIELVLAGDFDLFEAVGEAARDA